MPKRPYRPRDEDSCLSGGKPGNVVFWGMAGSYPPKQPHGPRKPGGMMVSRLYRWYPDKGWEPPHETG